MDAILWAGPFAAGGWRLKPARRRLASHLLIGSPVDVAQDGA